MPVRRVSDPAWWTERPSTGSAASDQTSAVELRLAGPGDEAGIAEVYVRTWQAAYRGQIADDFLDSLSIEERTGTWRQILDESVPGRACLVAEEAGRIIGFAHLSPSRDEAAAPGTGELTAIYLLEEHWDKGVGRALLERAVDLLTEAGFGAVTLWVLDTNARAQRFYEADGWARDGATQVSDRGTFTLFEVRYRRGLAVSDGPTPDAPPDLFEMPVRPVSPTSTTPGCCAELS